MSENYVIFSDSGCDLPNHIIEQYNIGIIRFPFMIDGEHFDENSSPLSIRDFYDKMREGSVTATSQATPDQFIKVFGEVLEKGKDILYICFSSGLSGTHNSAILAKETLLDDYPDRKINIVDSLCASMGEGLFVYTAALMQADGKDIDEVTEWCENNKLNVIHMFTVDDLVYLYRGGRVSRATQIAGSILGIKPVLHVDNEGHLVPVGKVRGRRQSLMGLIDGMAERIGGYTENITIGISHGDCYEDAVYVRDVISKRYNVKKFIINNIGPVIGAHSGPGTVALFFFGEKR